MIRKFYNLYLSAEKHFARDVYAITGYVPRDPFLYRLALRHASMVNTRKDSAKECNERLEFLGDSILDSIISEYLFKLYPTKDEGFLTEMRAKIVNRRSLNEISRQLKLDRLIQYNQSRKGQVNKSMYGDALEAFIGAFYLDQGFGLTKKFVLHKIMNNLIELTELEDKIFNFKSMLLEYVQKEKLEQLVYELVEEKGEGNDKHFRIVVKIGEKVMGKGDGKKKKIAEQNASQDALLRLKVISPEDIAQQA